MGNSIQIIRGTTNTFGITITDANGDPYTLQEGEALLFGVKKRAKDEDYTFKKNAVAGENGAYSVKVEPSDTEGLDFGRYFYDVGLQSGTDFFNVIPCSPFDICENITGREG